MNKCCLSMEALPLLQQADKIIIGLSGGADSVALTHLLFMAFGASKLLAAHVSHGIRKIEGQRDADFVRDFCAERKIPLQILAVDVPAQAAKSGMGLEECGRQLRYDFFAQLSQQEPGISLVVTAHNLEDNGETLLWNLCRGTGLKGMGGIAPQRGNLLRPLLGVSRQAIEHYVKAQGLPYVTDSTNQSSQYTRNRLRHEVMPILKQLNAGAPLHLHQGAQQAREAALYIAQKVNDLLLEAMQPANLLEQGDFLAKQALCQLAQSHGANPEHHHVQGLLQMLKAGSGSQSLPGGVQASLSCGQLLFTPIVQQRLVQMPLIVGIPCSFGSKEICLNQKQPEENAKINNLLFKNGIECATIKNGLTVGVRQEGDFFAPWGRGVTKSLKKLLQEAGIPVPLRSRLAVLRHGEEIVFVEGLGVAQAYAASGSAPYFQVTITQSQAYAAGVQEIKHDK